MSQFLRRIPCERTSKEQLHVDDTIALIRREQMVLAQQKRTWLQNGGSVKRDFRKEDSWW